MPLTYNSFYIYYIFGNLKLYCYLEKTIFRTTFLLQHKLQ